MKHDVRGHLKMKRGFSLVELLLYMGLISILLVILTSVFISVLDVQQSSQATSSAEQEGAFLLTRLTYDIHRASSITTPSVSGSPSSALTLVIGGVTYSYTISNGQVLLDINGVPESLSGVDTQISDLFFTRIGSPSGKATLQISFTVRGIGTSSQIPEIRRYESSIGLRHYESP